MNYQQIEDLLFEVDESENILDGYNYSQPFMCQRSNELADLFYLFSCGKDNTAYVLGYIVISPSSKKTIDYRVEKEPYDKFVLNGSIEKSKIKQYEEVYSSVHSFAFNKIINEEEIKILKSYLELLSQIMSQSQFEFYSNAVPEFFRWANKVMNSEL